MLSNPDNLEEAQLTWVQKISDTAEEFEDFEGYSQRQCEVITDIYKTYKKIPPKPFKSEETVKKGIIIQGNF